MTASDETKIQRFARMGELAVLRDDEEVPATGWAIRGNGAFRDAVQLGTLLRWGLVGTPEFFEEIEYAPLGGT